MAKLRSSYPFHLIGDTEMAENEEQAAVDIVNMLTAKVSTRTLDATFRRLIWFICANRWDSGKERVRWLEQQVKDYWERNGR